MFETFALGPGFACERHICPGVFVLESRIICVPVVYKCNSKESRISNGCINECFQSLYLLIMPESKIIMLVHHEHFKFI